MTSKVIEGQIKFFWHNHLLTDFVIFITFEPSDLRSHSKAVTLDHFFL